MNFGATTIITSSSSGSNGAIPTTARAVNTILREHHRDTLVTIIARECSKEIDTQIQLRTAHLNEIHGSDVDTKLRNAYIEYVVPPFILGRPSYDSQLVLKVLMVMYWRRSFRVSWFPWSPSTLRISWNI